MHAYQKCKDQLLVQPKTWLITGVAGFIGSNLLEALLLLDQNVIGLDNFSTGYQHNLDEVQSQITAKQWSRFRFVEGDICNLDDCLGVCNGVDYVLHEAALGSVPRSIENPITTNKVNISGFLNMLVAARDCSVKRLVYAASSSTYGDHATLPKVESRIGRPLSPYAVTKLVNELYAEVFSKTYNLDLVGLRYFNVFGRRQNPNGAYAAVIPTWLTSMLANESIYINGDGSTSRDFCYIENVIQANILAALTESQEQNSQIFNVAVGQRNSLNKLFNILKSELNKNGVNYSKNPIYQDFRAGDIKHSLADIGKIKLMLGYVPNFNLEQGLSKMVGNMLGLK